MLTDKEMPMQIAGGGGGDALASQMDSQLVLETPPPLSEADKAQLQKVLIEKVIKHV